MNVIAIANQKGGVAKTTTAVNLAAGLADRGHRTLLIDLDPQANATETMPITVAGLEQASIHDLLTTGRTFNEVVRSINPDLDFIPSHIKLARLEPSLVGPVDAYKLKDAITGLAYSYVIIDCPPSLGSLTTNALIAATDVIVPVRPAFFGLSAVADFMETIGQIQARLNNGLNVLGILVTLFDARTSIAQDVIEALQEDYGDLMFETRIAVNVRLDEAASAQQSIFSYDPRSSGAHNYAAFVEEVINRVEHKARAPT